MNRQVTSANRSLVCVFDLLSGEKKDKGAATRVNIFVADSGAQAANRLPDSVA